jgi:ABC-type Fe3+/spermidine/putrescine transport system ATPase subunit
MIVVEENARALPAGERVRLSLRPEKVRLSRGRPEARVGVNALEGVIEDVIYYGPHSRFWVRCGDRRLCAETHHRRDALEDQQLCHGDRIWMAWDARDGFLLDGDDGNEEEDALTEQ